MSKEDNKGYKDKSDLRLVRFYMDLDLMYWQNPTPDTSKFAVSYLLITYSLN